MRFDRSYVKKLSFLKNYKTQTEKIKVLAKKTKTHEEKLNVVYITREMPSIESGGQVRMFYLIKGICLFCNVSVVTVSATNKIQRQCKHELETLGVEFVIVDLPINVYPYSKKSIKYYQNVLDKLFSTTKIDCVITGMLTPELYYKIPPKIAAICDAMNIYSKIELSQVFINVLNLKERLKHLYKGIYYWLTEFGYHYEKFDMIFHDADYSARYANKSSKVPTFCVPLAQNTQKFKDLKLQCKNNVFIFIGTTYEPNIEAVQRLINWWPKIRKEVDKYDFNNKLPVLKVIGKVCEKLDYSKEYLDENGISLEGFVEKLESVVPKNAVAISPITSVSGMNTKVIQALSMKLPLVVSSESKRSIDEFVDGKNVILADISCGGLKRAILKVYKTPKEIDKLAENGWNLIKEKYDYKNVGERASNLIRICVESKKSNL